MNLRLILSILIINSSVLAYSQADEIPTQDSVITEEVQVETQEPSNFVVFKGDSLFTINANLGPYSPEERAQVISERLEQLVKDTRIISVDSFNISEVNNYSIISYKDLALFSIGDGDVVNLSQSRQELAFEYLDILKTYFSEVAEDATLVDWIKNIVFTLLAFAGLYLIFILIRKLFEWINKKLIQYEQGLKRKRKSVFKYLVPKESSNIFLVVSKIVRFGLIVLILFLYLPFLFSFLPWTRGLAEQFYGSISDPVTKILNGFVNFIPNLFSIAVIILISRYLLKILVYVAGEIEKDKLKIKGFHKDWAKPTYNLTRLILIAFTLVFIFQYLPSTKAFQGVSIFVGVLFTLGSTSAISNMIAGIVITYMRPFIIGDRVKIGNTVGDVVEKNLLVTRLKTPKNEDITIPNATIINTHLWNYSKNASSIGIILHTSVTIGYDIPSEQVVDLLLKAAKSTKNLTREYKPFVLQKSLNDFYVEYELNVYTKQPKKMPLFYSEIHKNILNEFNSAGVEILSPHYNAHRDGNASTIPGEIEPVGNPVEDVIDKITGKKKS